MGRDWSKDPERACERLRGRRRAGSRGKCRGQRLGPRERGNMVKFLLKYRDTKSVWGMGWDGMGALYTN